MITIVSRNNELVSRNNELVSRFNEIFLICIVGDFLCY